MAKTKITDDRYSVAEIAEDIKNKSGTRNLPPTSGLRRRLCATSTR